MAINPTTGLYDVTGGDTSATVTQGLNDNFTALWNRSGRSKSYVVEEGQSGDWHYRIYYQPDATVETTNATLEMWLQKEYNYSNLTTQSMWSNAWRVTLIPRVNYPSIGVTIANPPIEVAQITCDFGGLVGNDTGDNKNTNSATGRYSIIRPSSESTPSSTSKVRINYYVTYCFRL